jgi:hypothetical protein
VNEWLFVKCKRTNDNSYEIAITTPHYSILDASEDVEKGFANFYKEFPTSLIRMTEIEEVDTRVVVSTLSVVFHSDAKRSTISSALKAISTVVSVS